MSGATSTQVHRQLAGIDRERALELVSADHSPDAMRFDDLLTADLTHGPNPGFVAVTIESVEGQLLAYAQATAANDGFTIGCVAQPGVTGLGAGDADALVERAFRRLLAELPTTRAVSWWAGDRESALAASLGLLPHRRLLEMRVALPVEATTDVAVRGFRIGVDEQAWLEVNNAAFAWHGEQGGWTLPTLQQRQQEPWFDADGFLVHERDGRMAAFCWTKLHRQPALVGEIYVIAVHPDFHGLGLGRALTVAGLQHLHAVGGAPAAKLFVDADNTAAVTLYQHLGFTVAAAKQAYRRPPVTEEGSA